MLASPRSITTEALVRPAWVGQAEGAWMGRRPCLARISRSAIPARAFPVGRVAGTGSPTLDPPPWSLVEIPADSSSTTDRRSLPSLRTSARSERCSDSARVEAVSPPGSAEARARRCSVAASSTPSKGPHHRRVWFPPEAVEEWRTARTEGRPEARYPPSVRASVSQSLDRILQLLFERRPLVLRAPTSSCSHTRGSHTQ